MKRPPANILLVDDRWENLVALEAILEPLGQNLIIADSGEAALRALLRDEFAVVLLDVQMPDLDGYQTAQLIKGRERTRHVPIIFLTAVDSDDHAERRGYDAGAVDYLFKPFDPTVLRSKVGVFIDLHHLKREADELARRALHDPLTGLANRVLFHDRLEHALAHMGRVPSSVGVFYLDLDGFKPINDTMGHETGDALLKELAARLRSTVRGADTVARLGGDEFAVVSDTLEPPGAATVAERLLEAINQPFILPLGEACVSASIGVAVADGVADCDAVIRAADKAMYAAKAQGGGRWVLAGAQASTATTALDVVLVPRMSVASGLSVGWGVEVRDGERAAVDMTRLDAPTTFSLLQRSLSEADGAPVSIPMSSAALPNLVSGVREALEQSGAPSASLCVELPPDSLLGPRPRLWDALRELQRSGVGLAVRGVGTGAVSPVVLAGLPLSALVLAPESDEVATRGVVALGHALGLTIVAVDVEDSSRLHVAAERGCDVVEGSIAAPAIEARAA